MSEFTVQQASKYIIPDGQAQKGYMTRRGEAFGMDWIQAAILEGKGFTAKVGAFSTPVVGGGAGTVIDLDQPEFGMIIPDGTTIVPIRIAVQLATPLGATDADEVETVWFVDVTAATVAAALDGTWANTITPNNMRINLTNRANSGCTVKSVCSGDTTDPTEGVDLLHTQLTLDMNGTPANAIWTRHEALYEPRNPPYIVGPASLFGYWGGTVATSAFAQIWWLEFTSAHVA